MQFLFDQDSAIMQILSRLADVVVLNILFLLTCIPIFTIGSAITAMYDVAFRLDTEREGKMLPIYFQAFRANFRQATAIWMLFLVFGVATWVNMTLFSNIGGTWGTICILLITLAPVILGLIASYAFPLLSQFDNTVKETIKNALLLSLAYLPRSLVILAINAFPWILLAGNLYTFVKLGCLWLLMYFGAAAYMISRILNKVFKPYWEQGK